MPRKRPEGGLLPSVDKVVEVLRQDGIDIRKVSDAELAKKTGLTRTVIQKIHMLLLLHGDRYRTGDKFKEE